jgi:IstB-like ATP binding protein
MLQDAALREERPCRHCGLLGAAGDQERVAHPARLSPRALDADGPFGRQPGVNRKQMRGFAELEFIAKAENIVLVGKTGGRGKTGLACGLLLKALENGLPLPVRPRTRHIRRNVCVAGPAGFITDCRER